MQKSTIQFLISFLVLLTSCATNNFVKSFKPVVLEKQVYKIHYFSNADADYIYKANISVYGNELTGIFIAKKINETTHRVVFTTEFGNKLLDFEISETDFKVNSIVEELDNKLLINTLKSDFRLLLKNEFVIQKQFENGEDKIFQSKDGNQYNYLFVLKNDEIVYKIVHSSKRKQKISIIFTSENDTFVKNIIIEHQNINLRIELNYLINQ